MSAYANDVSGAIALISVQGPRSRDFLASVVADSGVLLALKFFRFGANRIDATEFDQVGRLKNAVEQAEARVRHVVDHALVREAEFAMHALLVAPDDRRHSGRGRLRDMAHDLPRIVDLRAWKPDRAGHPVLGLL